MPPRVKAKVQELFGNKWDESFWTDFILEFAEALKNTKLDDNKVAEILYLIVDDRLLEAETLGEMYKDTQVHQFSDMMKNHYGIPRAIAARIFTKFVAPHAIRPNPQPLADDRRFNQLSIEVTALRKDVFQMKTIDSKVCSYANYHSDKKDDNRVKEWTLPEYENLSLPDALLNYSENQGQETAVVKRYWKTIVENHRLIGTFRNGYEIGSLDSNPPNVGFYPNTVAVPTARHFVAFGECKGRDWTGTSSAERGQAMLYAHVILDRQPQRRQVYGFLTNNEKVVLIRAFRLPLSSIHGSVAIYWEISDVIPFEKRHGDFPPLGRT